MAKYLLVSFKTCPWVQRAAIVLREKKVEFEFRHIEPDNRPDWFLAISPHKKVPVLRIDDSVSLFESNAISEYLDETIKPQLHPADPIQRALNRAWTDYIPTFADLVTDTAYVADEKEYDEAIKKMAVPFERLEKALEKQAATNTDKGPYFNGAAYSLVDCGYAPFLQRHTWLDKIRPIGVIGKYPRVAAWRDALMARPSTWSFPPAEYETIYHGAVKRRKKYLSQFVIPAQAAAE